jgi:hypothetical protein
MWDPDWPSRENIGSDPDQHQERISDLDRHQENIRSGFRIGIKRECGIRISHQEKMSDRISIERKCVIWIGIARMSDPDRHLHDADPQHFYNTYTVGEIGI